MLVANSWSYARRDGGSRIEQAIWRGDTSPSLRAHFHNETQITIVLSGVRRFLTLLGPITVCAGETVIIGPTVPHKPLGLDAPCTVSVNLYVRPIADAVVARGAHVLSTPTWLQRHEWMDQDMLSAWAADQISPTTATAHTRDGEALAADTVNTNLEIGALAMQAGMTQEGFSRRFRRLVGLTPHAYRIAARLNTARALLASGVSPSAAAIDAGFADQSHLGRVFRSSFGTTPSLYRRAMR